MEQTLGARIGELRRAKGLKQDEVAERLGVSPQAVSKWENDISCPDIMMLPKLAELLEISVDRLLSGREETPVVQYLPPEKRKSFDDMMLRMRVTTDDGGTKVRINLPLALVRVVLESGGSLEGLTGGVSGKGIDFSRIIEMVESGMIGTLMEVDVEDGTHVEIVVE